MATSLQLQAPSHCLCNNKAIFPSTLLPKGKFNYRKCNPKSNFSSRFRVRAVKEKTEEIKNPPSAEDITKKYGLEAGLWKIFSSKEEEENAENKEKKSKGDQAKELLAKYGGAYLATSITLSLISFTLCYVGISTNETGEKVGTFALAYAAHKAASPIRFPPTVALTPIVAGWIGKKVDKEK
ncbi:hypothetical protein M9H77_16796 [Catharanthus roseus]|uniref:Uncharacterized protein n=1 Tax=Catharanthus roseus TaxID=4058 RepID=A0ACC0B2T6_CATRO|nr:hypothetical protein M9H77_16796 [Catharanthus roseus]